MYPKGAASPCPRISVILVIVVIAVQPPVDSVKYSSKYKDGDFVEKSKHVKNSFLSDKNLVNLTAESDVNESIENYWPVKVFNCVGSSGVEKCLKIFLIKRMKRVVNQLNDNRKSDVDINFDVVNELKNDFNWEEYNNINNDDLDNSIYDNIKNVFKNKNTKLVLYPGIEVDVAPDKNGTMQLNVKKDPNLELDPRGMKMPKKLFYRLIPMLLIPPLIMSGILPFVLPAMKIMILWVGMINQMALGGAIFTLMRNNAFQETTHTKKIIYVNDGYKNEKKPPPIIHHQQSHVFDKQPHYLHEKHHEQSHPSFHPPVQHFSKQGFPHLTTSGYEEDFDHGGDNGGGGDFSESGPNHFSQGHYGNIQHQHFDDDDEYDRTSHHFGGGFNNAFRRKERYRVG